MTGMSVAAMAWLEARSLDVEVGDRLGLFSSDAGFGETLVYPFIEKGEAVGHKHRLLVPREDKPRFWWRRGSKRPAYNVDCLSDDSLISEPVVIVEGQDDCIAALQCGIRRVISVPDGAPENPVKDLASSDKYKWLDDIFSLLKMDRTPAGIILAVDGDSAGAALMHDLSVKLGRARCKFITFPKAKDPEALGRERHKDLNEVLVDYGERGVVAVLDRAAWIKVNGVYKMSELPMSPDSVVYRLKDHGFEALDEHLRIRLGDLSVWTGVPSHGKTTALTDILCRIIMAYGVRVAWASFEQEPQRDHKRALQSWFCEDWALRLTREQRWAADTWIDEYHRFMVPDEDEDPTLEWMLEKMEAAVVQHGCKVVVLDPWNEGVHERDHGESETDYTNRTLRTIKRFAKRFGVHVAIVAHPTKMKRLDDGTYPIPSAYDITGSAAWYNKPDQIVIIHRMTEEETIFKIQKSRYHEVLGRPGIVKLAFTQQTKRYVETERNIVDLDPPRRRRDRG